MNDAKLKNILEGAILAADQPMNVDRLLKLFPEELETAPSREEIKAALEDLRGDYAGRGIELKEVASGYRFQVRQEYAPWIGRLWDEKPSRYSRALLETLALIAYRQPITRGEIEDIRGVSVSTTIMKTLQERDWVKIVGHRDVPGRPAMYATTRQFLDYFDLKSLEELPPLAELRNLDEIEASLSLEMEEKFARAANEALDDDEYPQDSAGDEEYAESAVDMQTEDDAEADEQCEVET